MFPLSWNTWVTKPGILYIAKQFTARVSDAVALVALLLNISNNFNFFVNADVWLGYKSSILLHLSLCQLRYWPSSRRIHSDYEWNHSLFSGISGSIPGPMRNHKSPRNSCPTKMQYKIINYFFLLIGGLLSYSATHKQL